MWSLLGNMGRKYINGPGHVTQDGRQAHKWQKPSKIFSYRTNSPMIMKLIMKNYYVLKLYKVYINNNPELTLTYFTTMSNLAKLVFGVDYRTIGPMVLWRNKQIHS